MNRKLLKFILSGALLLGCVGMFSSCKDTNEDQFALFEAKDISLQDQLDKANGKADQLQTQIDQLRTEIDEHLKNHPTSGCNCNLSELDSRLATIEAILNANNLGQGTNVAGQLTTLETGLAAIEEKLNNLDVKDYPGLEQLLEMADVDNLRKVLDDYEFATLPDALRDLIERVAALEGKKIPADLTDRVEALEGDVEDLQKALGVWDSEDDVATAIKKINEALDAKAEELQKQIDTIVKNLAEKVSQEDFDNTVEALKKSLTDGLKDLQDQIDAINQELKTFAKVEDLQKLEDRLNSIINSIVIQQVSNKVFGSLMLPLGIQTNILMAYHGYNGSGITEFPSVRTAYEYNGGKAFTSAELTGVEEFSVPSTILDESENNAGNVYFTVNPSNVDLSKSVFSLVNSLDYPCGIELSTPVACDKLLLYGWSRANNGFYSSNAYLSEENLDKCALSLGDDLKKEIGATAKDFLRDLRHMDRPDISQIAATIKNVLQKLNGKLSANAIKGEYQYTDLAGQTVKAATYSNYGIAALTFQPQSFCFLEGQENKFDKLPSLPTIGDFEFEMGDIQINFNTNFQVNGLDVNLTFNKIQINEDDFTVTGTVLVDVYDPVNNTVKQEERPITAKAEGIQDLVDDINAELEKIIGQVNDDVIKQVNEMVDSINDQVKEMLDKMSADVNDQLNDLMGDLSDEVNGQLSKYTDRINSLINKVNRLIARVNRVLANPNRYLQPRGMYTSNGGQDIHILSTSRVAPSKFNMNGGNATTLYFTSYTLETIAPAYKKFVKVVNAWKNGDASRTTVDSAVNNANSKGNLNEVINGNQIRFAFAPEAGYTYELVFQAVDYQGYTSTHRCFIEVR